VFANLSVAVLFGALTSHRQEPLWDAVKKSLDVASNPVNLRLITGIKALSPATLKAAQLA
jgi:hypothetical protein